MSRLPSSRKVVAVLGKNGFSFVSQKGSHAKFRCLRNGKLSTVIVPMGKKEIPRGTIASIARQSGLKRTDFI